MNHKKCKLVNWEFLSTERKRLGETKKIPCKYCPKHKVIVCRCGEEFGSHYGTNSKELK